MVGYRRKLNASQMNSACQARKLTQREQDEHLHTNSPLAYSSGQLRTTHMRNIRMMNSCTLQAQTHTLTDRERKRTTQSGKWTFSVPLRFPRGKGVVRRHVGGTRVVLVERIGHVAGVHAQIQVGKKKILPDEKSCGNEHCATAATLLLLRCFNGCAPATHSDRTPVCLLNVGRP